MVNHAIREHDEWFDEPDDLERVARTLTAVADTEEPVRAAGVLAFIVARAQGCAEGNKRTALLSLAGSSTKTATRAPGCCQQAIGSSRTC
jgi:hypothetical protein